MSHRIHKMPFAEDPMIEQGENSPEDLVNDLEPRPGGRRTKSVIDGLKEKYKTATGKGKNKESGKEPGYLLPLQGRPDYPVAELPANDMVIEESRSKGAAYFHPAELEGGSHMPVHVRGQDGGAPQQNMYLDSDSNSSTAAEADLPVTEKKELISELPSSPSYRRPPPVPVERGGSPTGSFVKVSGTDPSTELMRIQNEVLRAIIDFPELRGPEPTPRFESTESTIIRIFAEYGHMRDSNNRTKREYAEHFLKVQGDLRAANTGLQNELNARERELKGLKPRHEQELEGLRREISSLKYQKKELESSHGNRLRKEKRSLQNDIESLESKLRRNQNDAESEKRDLGKRLDKANKVIDDIKAKWLREATMWQQHRNKLEEANSDLDRLLQRAKSDEQKRVNTVEGEWRDKLLQERHEHEESMRKLRSDIDQLKGDLVREKSRHQEALRKQEVVLMKRYEDKEKEYEAKEKEYETVIEDFKSSSARREHFKGMTDSQAAAQYKRLANSIDEFSRIEWERNKEHTWPIPDKDMSRLARNTRKLKQHIIQNTLWLLLYDHVFQSPFKILGIDGEQDDKEWIPIYSSGRQYI
jgi:predicted  nucleic acid-binding Zn-ribbon protein